MSNNNLQDSGVKLLCTALKNVKCELEVLRISYCSISGEGYKALASALRSNPSHLIELDLRGNDPGQSGVKELTELLQDPHCTLKTLRFLSPAADEGCQFVTGILGKNPLLLKELNLSDCELGDTGVNQLSALLQDKHCKPKTLMLRGCGLKEETCSALATVLGSDTSLKELDMSNNNLQDLGVKKLQSGLENTNCTLEKLSLSDCNISEEGYKALASALRSNPSHLIELNLRGNDPGQSGVKELTELLQDPHCTLKTLRFLSPAAEEFCQFVTGIVGKNPLLLKELYLSDHELGDTRVNQLSALLQDKHCTVSTLILHNCGLTKESCSALASALSSDTSLKELDLCNNNLQDSGVKKLQSELQNTNWRLKKLRLSKCDLTEESCSALASVLTSDSSSLKDLDLSNNNLQDSGVKLLSDGLKDSKLEKLSLSDCSISEEGYKALASALRSNPSHLIELDLRGNDPGQSGVKELIELLQDPLCTLKTLRFLSPAADEACQFVTGIVGKNLLLLKELNLSDRQLGDTRVNQLSALLQDKHCTLNTLMLNNNRITAEGCAALTSAFNLNPSNLMELTLSGNKLEDSGVEKICSLLKNTQCRLKKLSLSDCRITEEGYKSLTLSLKSNSHLIELDLRGNDPGQSGVKELTDLQRGDCCKLKTVRFLKSSAAQEACDYLTKAVGKSPLLLTKLDLSEVKLGDLDGEKLSALLKDSHSKVEKIKLNNCELTEKSCSVLAAVLSSKTILKEMNLNNSRLLDSGVREICEGLKNPVCELKILNLSDCSISEEGYKALASALRSNPSHLIELDLRGNDPGQSGVKKLTDLLQDPHCTLNTLRFLSPAAEEACQFVTGIVGKNPILLKELNLSDHELGDTRVNQLSALLQDKHCKLNTLILKNSFISEEDCRVLAEAFNSNPSNLRELNLNGTKLTNSGMKSFNTLFQNQQCRLEKLKFSSMCITAEGCAALTSAFNSNPSHLKELNLSGNKLGDSGVRKISSLLRNSQCMLKILGLSDCSISEEGYKALASALRSNPLHLIELDLRGNDPGPSGVKELTGLLLDPHCTLTTLRFLSPAADEFCQFVSGIVGKYPLLLKELNLSDRGLGDTRVNQLSALLQDKHFRLNTLMLNNNRITAEGCAALTSAFNLNPSHLIELNLSGNKLEDSGVEKICPLLENIQCRLEKLSLSDCSIREEGYKALASALRSNPSHLIELDLRGNDPGQSGVKELTDLLQSRSCKFRFLKSSAAQEACEYLTNVLGISPLLLTELDLSEVKLGDLDWEKLSALLMDSHSKVEKIKLNNCELTEKSCSVLAAVLSSKTILKELNLNNSRLLDSGVRKICEGLKNPVCELKILNLSDCSITEEGYEALASALRSNPSHLIELDLRGNDPGQSGVKELTELLQDPHCALKTLRFLRSPAADEGCQLVTGVVGKNPLLLKELNLSDHELGDTRVNQLSALLQDKHCQINTLNLSYCSITEKQCEILTSALKSNPSHLRELDLSGNELGDFQSLGSLLKNQQFKLEKLILCVCSIKEKQCEILTSALKSNPSHLRELNLSGNELKHRRVKQFFDVLKKSTCKLERLRLRYCSIQADDCTDLASALKSNPSHLRELDLSGNNLGDSGVKKLSDLLINQQFKLEKLRLSYCSITEKQCVILTSALKSNPSHLRELNLNGNRLGDSGADGLNHLLSSVDCKLNKLHLCDCSITEKQLLIPITATCMGLLHLRELDLSKNQIKNQGVYMLCDVLKNPRCRLKRLRLNDCGITDVTPLTQSLTKDKALKFLKELELSKNQMGFFEKQKLSDLLRDSNCKLRLEEEEGYFRAGVKRVTTFLMPPWSKVQKPVDLTGEESSSSDEDASEDETDQAEEADKLSNEAD
nr:protein NLRC5 isoform X13 [Danio rerio]|eukprot:XP_021325107.1 protein NLRC5 isoform X13 [Danio rerio]